MTITLQGQNLVGRSFSRKGDSIFRAVNPATLEELEPDFSRLPQRKSTMH